VVPEHTRAGDVLADRYRLTDLLTENEGGRFWRAFDTVLHRDVAVHIIAVTDRRAPLLRDAARRSATVFDRRMLRVLDIDEADDRCFVVNEWGSGTSLDILLAQGNPLPPIVAAWIVAEVGDTLALTHESAVAHGRLVPENVLIDHDGAVRLIGLAVDAALHGLPPGRTGTDIVDLVGLLYAGLTGKWAGVSRSVVPAAPSQHGHVLRPRQVRAGIPRTLDSLCDHVLNHGGDADVNAAMVSDALREFLGTSATSAEVWLARLEHPRSVDGTVVLPPLPDPPAPLDSSYAPGTLGEASMADEDRDDAEEASSEDDGIATQAGMPIFHDDTGDVTWLAHRTEAAPPPPPLDPPPERPLFAPDPEDGQPARRPRVVAPPADRSAGGFWPWDTGTGTGTGGSLLVMSDEDEEDDRTPPGTNFLRLAGVIAACLVVLLVCVIVFNLGRGRTPLGATRENGGASPSTPTTSAPVAATPLHVVSARDFDPQGNPPSENPNEVQYALDGNPSTAWSTMTYTQQFGPGGLKTGVGLVLDLGAVHKVSEVDLTTVGSPTQVQIFVMSQSPSTLQGQKPDGGTTVTGTHGTVKLDPAPSGRYVVVWLTRLPAVSTGFRGGISGVVVKGD
jgi:hypothetical protein